MDLRFQSAWCKDVKPHKDHLIWDAFAESHHRNRAALAFSQDDYFAEQKHRVVSHRLDSSHFDVAPVALWSLRSLPGTAHRAICHPRSLRFRMCRIAQDHGT